MDPSGNVVGKLKRTSPDAVVVQGVLESGALATAQIITTTASTPDSVVWIISGEKGALKLEGQSLIIQMFAPKLYRFKKAEQAWQIHYVAQKESGTWEEVEAETKSQVFEEYLAFAEDRKDSYVSFDQAVVRHRMVEAIWKSARDGTRETYDKNVV